MKKKKVEKGDVEKEVSSEDIQRRKKLSQLFPSCVFLGKKKKKEMSERGTAGTSLVSQFILNQLFFSIRDRKSVV